MKKAFVFFILSTLAPLIMTGCSREIPPEEKAIRLVEASQALGGSLSVKMTIDNWLAERGDKVKPIGWAVHKKQDHVYLVSYTYNVYSFREGTGERGFFFEANLATGAVRNVTKDFVREMGPLSPSLKEGEVREKLMQRFEDEQKLLSGDEPGEALPTVK